MSALVVCCTAYGGGSGSGYGGRSSGGYGSSKAAGQVIPAAVQTRHSIEYRDVPSSGAVNPTTIEVSSNANPVNIVFKSQSSNLNIQQVHEGKTVLLFLEFVFMTALFYLF